MHKLGWDSRQTKTKQSSDQTLNSQAEAAPSHHAHCSNKTLQEPTRKKSSPSLLQQGQLRGRGLIQPPVLSLGMPARGRVQVGALTLPSSSVTAPRWTDAAVETQRLSVPSEAHKMRCHASPAPDDLFRKN